MWAELLPFLLPMPALIALSLTVANALWWPRGRRLAAVSPGISVCIPARNEANSIEACVRAALATGAAEVVVLDDGSTDDTPAILARLAASDARLKVIRLDAALPAGWVGKPRACALLEQRAVGPHLVFIDADVVLAPDALARLEALRTDYAADVITAVPRQLAVSPVERLVMPLLHVTYTSWLFLPLIWRTRDARFLAANGQILWLERAALDVIGGFRAVKGEIVDDMALCRAVKKSGLRVLFADGDLLGTCRMYRSARQVVDGFSKNLFEGIGGSVFALVVVVGLYSGAFIVPLVVLAAHGVRAVIAGDVGVAAEAALCWAAAVGVVAGLALRLVHVARHGSTVWSAVANPVGVVVLLAIAVRSWWWSTRGQITWAGRAYGARRSRMAQ